MPEPYPGLRPGRGGRISTLLLFFLSGACGLVCEVVWMRMLTLVFGATAFATANILASFFAGLALGSFTFGRLIDRGGGHPLKVYALLEGGIGVFAFLMPVLLAGLDDAYVHISRSWGLGFYPLSLVRFSLSFLVLMIPATMMGGTLPVILKYFARTRESLGWNVGTLYAVNTFGALLGTVCAGFFFILLFGVKEAAYLAGGVNLLIAVAVFLLYLRQSGEEGARGKAEVAPGSGEEGREGVFPSRLARLALWAIAISGFCSLALEVFWTRALVFFLDNSTHAFTTILTGFLLGIALGSSAVAHFVDRRKRLLGCLGGRHAIRRGEGGLRGTGPGRHQRGGVLRVRQPRRRRHAEVQRHPGGREELCPGGGREIRRHLHRRHLSEDGGKRQPVCPGVL